MQAYLYFSHLFCPKTVMFSFWFFGCPACFACFAAEWSTGGLACSNFTRDTNLSVPLAVSDLLRMCSRFTSLGPRWKAEAWVFSLDQWTFSVFFHGHGFFFNHVLTPFKKLITRACTKLITWYWSLDRRRFRCQNQYLVRSWNQWDQCFPYQSIPFNKSWLLLKPPISRVHMFCCQATWHTILFVTFRSSVNWSNTAS